MAKSEHTPGPWEYTDGDVWIDTRRQVCCGRGYQECCGEPNIEGGQELIAQTSPANARLIAAAPDGLAFALAHDAYMLDAGYAGPDDKALHPKAAENWRRCRAFIARATDTAVENKQSADID